MLVGSDTADDAGVFRIGRDRALVQTVDFFTPIVDEPFVYGQIAAANALSDVYAMGGRPVTAMNILGVPIDRVPISVIGAILQGGAAKVREASCLLIGGHTIRNPVPIYGLSVTGFVSPHRLITNADAIPGDLLVLTKPLGTGIISTAIKRRLSSAILAQKAIDVMTRLNDVGPVLAERRLVQAGTDITGFGLLGHLHNICDASNVGAELFAGNVPVIDKAIWTLADKGCVPGGTLQNLKTANEFVDWDSVRNAQKYVLADAQTSGGLLLCVHPKRWLAVKQVLVERRVMCTALVGQIVKRRSRRLVVRSASDDYLRSQSDS